MNQWIKTTIFIMVSIMYLFIYWSVIYIGIDKMTFELSRNFIYFASAKVVYDMFLINIVVSLLFSQIIVALNAIFYIKKNRLFKQINFIHIPLLILFLYLIYITDSVIPFVKNWHVSLL